MIFEQLRPDDGTGTLTYFIADPDAGIAAVVDPTVAGVDAVLAAVRRYGVRLDFVADTHTHADHVSGAARLRAETGARLVMHEKTKTKVITYEDADRIGIGTTLRENEKTPVDRYVDEGDAIEVGSLRLEVLSTPGHTDNHMCLMIGNRLLTGDLLLVGQAGRADLPGGNPEVQFETLRTKILPLPDDTIIYPGHDYGNNVSTTLGEERTHNEFLRKNTPEEYVAYMREFFPPIAEAGPGDIVTLQCGVTRVPRASDEVGEIPADELAAWMRTHPATVLLDVREAFEIQVFGDIPAAVNIPLRQLEQRLAELPEDASHPIIAICQSGSRSYEAAFILRSHGYRNVYNLRGGMVAYAEALPS